MSTANNNIKVRAAGFEDASVIFNLIKSYPEELIPRPITDIVENIDRFLVCETDNDIIGTVSWQILPEIGAPKQPSVEIKSLAVKKQFHRSGIGKLLVTSAIDHIRPLHPFQIIALTFHPEFFSTLGFRKIEKQSLIHKIYMGCKNCSKYDSPFTCPETAVAMDINTVTQSA